MAKPAMKVLGHLSAGFGPKTCYFEKELRRVRRASSALNKNRPTRQLGHYFSYCYFFLPCDFLL